MSAGSSPSPPGGAAATPAGSGFGAASSVAPHESQNRAPSRFSLPQLGHRISGLQLHQGIARGPVGSVTPGGLSSPTARLLAVVPARREGVAALYARAVHERGQARRERRLRFGGRGSGRRGSEVIELVGIGGEVVVLALGGR